MFMIAFQQSLASPGFTKNLQFRCRYSRFRLQCIEGFPDTFLYFLSPILILMTLHLPAELLAICDLSTLKLESG